MMVKQHSLIALHNITKTYQVGQETVHALAGVSLSIAPRSFVAISGTSGSGKSTLMHIIGCLDHPSSGTYLLDTQDVAALSQAELAYIRNTFIGFVFQRFNLLATLTAWENIALPLRYAGYPEHEIATRTNTVLKEVEMEHRATHYPWQLAGGQQQRIAIARALVTHPKLIIADEPTGNLDTRTGTVIMQLLTTMHKKHKATLIIVTHESEVAAYAQRNIKVVDGKIVSDTGSK